MKGEEYDEDETFSSSNEEVQKLLVEKASELFALCDKETKGFITKRDMQRLRQELPLSPEQLEDVFDNLDGDQNGYLTLEEFTDGFGSFLGLEPSKRPSLTPEDDNDMNKNMNEESIEDEIDDDQFQSLLDHIGGKDIFSESSEVKEMWSGMKNHNPKLLMHFEDFLGRVTKEMKQNKAEYANLEKAYHSKSNMYDDQIRKLYEEMETQIGHEKERLLAEENARETKIREELETELREKDLILQEILFKHKSMEKNLSELNVTETETKQENLKLIKEKNKLEKNLDESKKIIEEMRMHTDSLRKNANEDKRIRARAALQASEGIALERESLVRQLDVLRSINQRLMDEKDESMTVNMPNTREERLSDVIKEEQNGPVPKPRRLLEKRGSTIGDYLDQPTNFNRQLKPNSSPLRSINDGNECNSMDLDCDYDDSFYENHINVSNGDVGNKDSNDLYVQNNLNVTSSPKVLNSTHLRRSASLSDNNLNDENDEHEFSLSENDASKPKIPVNDVNRKSSSNGIITACTTEPLPKALWKVKHGVYPAALANTENLDKEDHWKVQKTFYTGKSVNKDETEIPKSEGWKVKKNYYFDNPLHDEGTGQMLDTWKVQLMLFPAAMISVQLSDEDDITSEISEPNVLQYPERVYKVVFIGDSSVGKTSFINRFCKDSFNEHFSATIGVDFQVKQMEAEGRNIALQLWDTAGQERYRSITKQYFRRSDGVVVMYDVTSESSFKNLRSWVQSIEDVADEHVVLMILGNKIDLCQNDDDRVISLKQAERLADEFSALHFEVSARNGDGVERAMKAFAGILQEKEDEEIEKVLQLKDEYKKKCCKT